MSDTKEQTLPDIFVKLHNWFHRIYTDEARDGEEISHSDAMVAIQSAMADAIPEKYPDPDKAFTDDKIDWDALQAQRAYNFAIDQFTANLKAKGLLR